MSKRSFFMLKKSGHHLNTPHKLCWQTSAIAMTPKSQENTGESQISAVKNKTCQDFYGNLDTSLMFLFYKYQAWKRNETAHGE